MIQFTVYGQVVSMKNSKIQTVKGRRAFSFKHPKCVKFENDFIMQVPMDARKYLSGPLRAIVTVFYPSERQDLDCSVIYDLLQAAQVVKNDRQIIEKHEYRATDKNNPRVDITIEEL